MLHLMLRSVLLVVFNGLLATLATNACCQDATRIRQSSLDIKTAEAWAALVLKGIDAEYPNKLSVTYTKSEQIVSPKQMFPAFFGCFDWHSSVHGHWLLVRLLRTHPQMKSAAAIREVLSRHLTEENLLREKEFFARDEQKSFERMYGWAWYLRLMMELDAWDDADAKKWRRHGQPLETLLVDRVQAYLPLLDFPIRTGEHPDTGFALGQLIDYSRAMKNTDLETLLVKRARDYYMKDEAYPVQYEPSGHDFFSSGWNEADLMRRVLGPSEFETWFARFLPNLTTQLRDGTIEPVKVSDITDGKLVHLAGLNLNRAWCMRAVAESLPQSHPLRSLLTQSSSEHLAAGLAYINSGHYEGDHWLATFGLYATP